MALAACQHGYDVVSADGERISVKTVTSASHVSFKKSTFNLVDRVLILRIKLDEGEAAIEELLDCSSDRIAEFTAESSTEYVFHVRRGQRLQRKLENLAVVAEASHGPWRVLHYDNGTITVSHDGRVLPQAKPALREVANDLGVSVLNGNGNPANTRQLGAAILARLGASVRSDPEVQIAHVI